MTNGVFPHLPQPERAFEEAEILLVRNLHLLASPDVRTRLGLELLDIGGSTLELLARFPMLPAFNRTLGLGLKRPTTDEDLASIQAAARQHEVAQIHVAVHPQAEPSDLEARLLALGATPDRATIQLGRGTEPVAASTSTQIEVREVGLESLDAFVDLSLRAFGMPDDFQSLVKGLGQGTMGQLAWHSYLAFRENEAVGCATLAMVGDFGWLGNAATLPEFRKQGVQTALIARRMQDGVTLGARQFFTQVDEDLTESPNPSDHNMRRAGFIPVYRRLNYLLPCH